MQAEEVLSFQEIISVISIDDLMELYVSKVPTFSEKDFISLLKADWQLALDKILNQQDKKHLPNVLPNLASTVNQSKYRAFGVEHGLFSKREPYLTIVQNTIRNARNLVFENCLGYKYARSTSLEMADYYPVPFRANFEFGFEVGRRVPFTVVEALLSISGNYSNQRMDINLDLLEIPLEFLIHELPAYVEIELRKRAGKQLNFSQFRSAYMAVFMRFFSPDGCDILAGANHAAEIQYFLSEGVHNQKLVETAHYHAELMRTNPEKLKWLRYAGYSKNGVQGGVGALAGLALSWLPRRLSEPLY